MTSYDFLQGISVWLPMRLFVYIEYKPKMFQVKIHHTRCYS